MNGFLTQLEKFDAYFGLTSCPIPDIQLYRTEFDQPSIQEHISARVAQPTSLRSDDSFREF